MSKRVDNSEYSMYTVNRTFVREMLSEHRTNRGECFMTDNEKELLRTIRENDNPARALMTATLIVLGFLKQHGSSQEPIVADLRELS